MNTNTARTFTVQFGAMLALYTTLSFLVTLLFAVIDLQIPDAADAAWRYESYLSSVRFGIAGTIVFAPVYLTLTYFSTRMRRQEQHIQYGTTMRWLLYLSLLVAGGIMLGSLVAVIVSYLNGELTLRFILKIAVLLALLGSAFAYYLFDVRDMWLTNISLLKTVGAGAVLVLLLALGLGIYSNVSPSEAREYRFDQLQIEALMQISYAIDAYVEREGVLPETLDALYRSERQLPKAPEGRPDFTYTILGDLEYELCAEFRHDSREIGGAMYAPYARYDSQVRDWSYDAGRWCFTIRAVVPTQQLRTDTID